jgi:hypothetical protein
VEPIVEPTVLTALRWPHAARRTGHIERLPSGSYRVHVYAGPDPLTGRRLRYRQTVRTERQAQTVLGRLLEQAEGGSAGHRCHGR